MKRIHRDTDFCLAVAARLERANVPFELVSTGKGATLTCRTGEALLVAASQESRERLLKDSSRIS